MRHIFISIVAGLVLTTAFAPWHFFPLGMVVAGVMLHVWLTNPPRQAAICGYCFGLSYFGSGVYWLYFSLHDYGGASVLFAVTATVVFAALLALYFLVLAWSVAYCARRWQTPWIGLLVYPSLWVLFEYLRSLLFTGFPWNLLGQMLVDSPFAGIVPILGVLGGSWWVVFVGAWGRSLYLQRRHGIGRNIAAFVAVLGLVGATSLIPWTQAQGDKITVGIVQSGIPQGVKFDPDKMRDIIQTHRQLTERIAHLDLVLWSETAIPAYYHQLEQELFLPTRRMISEAGGKHFLTGAFFRDDEEGATYNSVVSVGSVPQVYHKQHLVPFGEYVPLRSWLDIFNQYVQIPMSDLSAGTEPPLLELNGVSVGIAICYEVAFGSFLAQALPTASYWINVSNDSWFGNSIAPYQHLQIARLRALETGRDMIRATSTGISAIINHTGKLRADIQFGQHTLASSIQPRTGTTPYIYWRDGAILILSVVLVAGVIFKSVTGGKGYDKA